MSQTFIWRPLSGIHNPLDRPQDYTSQRQELAKVNGRTHFQLAPNIMAPAPSVSSSFSVPSSSLDFWGYHHPQQLRQPHTRYSQPRGRDRTVRHLWSYSPERARIEVEEQQALEREKKRMFREEKDRQRNLAAQVPGTYKPEPALTQFERAAEIISADAPDFEAELHDRRSWSQQTSSSSAHLHPNNGHHASSNADSSPSPSDTTTTSSSQTTNASSTSRHSPISPVHATTTGPLHYEAPNASTSLRPILARPPADLTEPTELERSAYNADEADGAVKDDQLNYLYPPNSTSSLDEKAPVLYTRSQLPELDLGSRHLWHALHNFKPVTTDFKTGYAAQVSHSAPHPISSSASAASCPFLASSSAAASSATATIRSIFNWSSVQLPISLSQSWYGVIFRSVRRHGSESMNLYEDDRLSHEEAVSSGGLIMYIYGEPDKETGENVASCIWTSRADAIKASRLPLHTKAAKHAQAAYEKFELARYKVVKVAGETGLRIEEWSD